MPLRGPITPQAATALVDLVVAIRPDWHPTGTRSGIQQAATGRHEDFGLPELAYAVVHAAMNPKVRTPAGIALDGPHWTAPKDPHAAPKIRPITCPDCGRVHTRDEGCKTTEPADPATQRRAIDELRAIALAKRDELCSHRTPYANCLEPTCKAEAARRREDHR